MKEQIKKLYKPIDGSALGLFRIFFGLVCVIHLIDQYKYISDKYIVPKFYFSYPLLEFIKPLPATWMYIIFWIMMIASVSIVLGIYYRQAIITFFILYAYTFFIDIAHYKNHHYLLLLLTFLLMFMNADSKYSLKGDNSQKNCYWWNIAILRFQFCIVYFFAGLTKLNTDWLNGEPTRYILRQGTGRWRESLFGTLYQHDWFISAFNYCGLIFDLAIPFLLLNRKTRKAAVVLALIFHGTNELIFPNILIFPIIMLASLIIFLEPGWPKSFLKPKSKEDGQPHEYEIYNANYTTLNPKLPSPFVQKLTSILIGIYCLLQITVPLRHYLYPGDIMWSSQGDRFSWRMIAKRVKGSEVLFKVTDPNSDRIWVIDPSEGYFARRQYLNMTVRPEMILMFAHHLRDLYTEQGTKDPIITVDSRLSVNGRDHALLINKQVNLSKVKRFSNYTQWLMPYDSSYDNEKINAATKR